jgi:hypothetical protein
MVYLNTPQGAQTIGAIASRDLITHCKDAEGNGCAQLSGTILACFQSDIEQPQTASIRMAGLLAKILSRELLKMNSNPHNINGSFKKMNQKYGLECVPL